MNDLNNAQIAALVLEAREITRDIFAGNFDGLERKNAIRRELMFDGFTWEQVHNMINEFSPERPEIVNIPESEAMTHARKIAHAEGIRYALTYVRDELGFVEIEASDIYRDAMNGEAN